MIVLVPGLFLILRVAMISGVFSVIVTVAVSCIPLPLVTVRVVTPAETAVTIFPSMKTLLLSAERVNDLLVAYQGTV